VDIYTIIFLALAVFIFLRLRNVLGQRTGNERPPYDRTARNVVQGAQDNNVVPMPSPARRWLRGWTPLQHRIPRSIRAISSAAHAAPMR
jgi:predicted lipid-binding transport protein (Tim44 family)